LFVCAIVKEDYYEDITEDSSLWRCSFVEEYWHVEIL